MGSAAVGEARSELGSVKDAGYGPARAHELSLISCNFMHRVRSIPVYSCMSHSRAAKESDAKRLSSRSVRLGNWGRWP